MPPDAAFAHRNQGLSGERSSPPKRSESAVLMDRPYTRASAKFRADPDARSREAAEPSGEAAPDGNPARAGACAPAIRRPLPLRRLPWHRRSSGRRGRRKRRLRPEHLHERLIGALLVRVSAADSNRANQLIVHHDRQTARNEVVGKALRLCRGPSRIRRPSTVLNRCATEADDARAYSAVLAFIKPVSAPMGSTPSIAWESMISPVGESTKMTIDCVPGLRLLPLDAGVDDRPGGVGIDHRLHQRSLGDIIRYRHFVEWSGRGALGPGVCASERECRGNHCQNHCRPKQPCMFPHVDFPLISSRLVFLTDVSPASRKRALNSSRIFRLEFPATGTLHPDGCVSQSEPLRPQNRRPYQTITDKSWGLCRGRTVPRIPRWNGHFLASNQLNICSFPSFNAPARFMKCMVLRTR